MRYCITTIIVFLCLIAQVCSGQNMPLNEQSDTTKNTFIKIVGAQQQIYEVLGGEETFTAIGDVRISHDSTFMFTEKATLVDGVELTAKGNVIILKNDTIRVFADSLLYRADSSMAYFVGNVVLEDGDKQLFTSFLQYDLEKDWAIYTDTALVITDNIEVKSKHGVFHLDENYVNFYEAVTIEGHDFDLLSDSLRFYTELQKAIFLSPTIINQEERRIYSEGGYYDIKNKQSEFYGNAQLQEDDRVTTADTIRNNDLKEVHRLIGNAFFKTTSEEGSADLIIMDQKAHEIELAGNAKFKNSENEVSGNYIVYNKETDGIAISGRTFFSNPPMLIYADDLDYDKTVGIATAKGNVIWQDTANNVEVLCDYARYVDSTNFMKAYNLEGKPLMINGVKEGDTMFLSGDTLISFTQRIDSDTFRFFKAFEHVEMLHSDMQAVCDSLIYDGRDSLFSLYHSPVMWSDSSQFLGDTILISMSNDAVDRIYLKERALIISTSDFQFFDQIKGKDIQAIFKNEEIDQMRVRGNAEALYYIKDKEGAYLSVNKTACSRMIFQFEKGELLQTRFYTEPISKMTPMKQADHEKLKLPGFNWMIERRPQTKEDLLN